jgi:hypothetical protein
MFPCKIPISCVRSLYDIRPFYSFVTVECCRDAHHPTYNRSMSTEQILTLTLAIYGAVVSTILAYREIQKGRRRILIRLDYAYFLEIAEITITNVGYRPIAITGVGMHPEGSDMVPSNALLSTRHSESQPLPVTINDGENVTLPLSDAVSNILLENNMKADIVVHDAEGRTYRKHKTGKRNPKWVNFGNS